jgi:hypothetical protein
MPHTIANEYNKMKSSFGISALSDEVTNQFKIINDLCATEINNMNFLPITSGATVQGKNYVVLSYNDTLLDTTGKENKHSRPINIDLYNAGMQIVTNGKTKVDIFFENLSTNQISLQTADDITQAVYVIAMNYCCCADLVAGVKSNSGDYFEKFVGHLYARHLELNPSTSMNACELDDESIPIPTDYIFNLGTGKPKFHVPVKTSTRERCVEVWAQQRILDGAYGVGRFICLLTCIAETNYNSGNKSVDIVCVPNQWINYQLFISQIKRAYYLDMPSRYDALNNHFPRIHVKCFGEFFHESDSLID